MGVGDVVQTWSGVFGVEEGRNNVVVGDVVIKITDLRLRQVEFGELENFVGDGDEVTMVKILRFWHFEKVGEGVRKGVCFLLVGLADTSGGVDGVGGSLRFVFEAVD